MIECKICRKKCSGLSKLQEHISIKHKEVSLEDYYVKNLIEDAFDFNCPICGRRKKFNNLKYGFSLTCGRRGSCATKLGTIIKYGVDNVKKLCCVNEKTRETCLKKYGVENVGQLKEVQEKMKKTMLQIYGVENPLQSKDIKEKIQKTLFRKYGVVHQSYSPEVQGRSRETKRRKQVLKVGNMLDELNVELLSRYTYATDSELKFRCKKCGNEFKTTWYNVGFQKYKCPKCYPRNKSIGDIEVRDFIKSLGFELKTDKTVIKPLELDILIESKKLAIEYCGLYWHDEKVLEQKTISSIILNGKNYHLNKLEQCIKAGYKLITIFEDEWILKQDIVKARLKRILGVDKDTIKVRASDCEIKEIDSKAKNEFLIQYHIQGTDNSSIKLGSYYNTELVAVMTFSKGSLAKGVKSQVQGVWELNRFCSHSGYHVYGIASKLLQYFKAHYDWHEIYSYADRRWSDGNLYLKLGFELVSTTGPNYWYWGNNIVGRAHRFNYRKSNLKQMKNYDPELTEFQIMFLEGYGRIYDCGNLKFKL